MKTTVYYTIDGDPKAKKVLSYKAWLKAVAEHGDQINYIQLIPFLGRPEIYRRNPDRKTYRRSEC